MVEDFRQWGDPSNFHLIGISHLQHIKQQSILWILGVKTSKLIQFRYHKYNNSIHSRFDQIYASKSKKNY